MSFPPDLVSKNGDISVHGREGAVIFVSITGVSAGDLSFEIVGQAPIGLTATSTPDQYQLVIPQAAVDALPLAGAEFALRVTGGVVPLVFWEGSIRRRGFAAP